MSDIVEEFLKPDTNKGLFYGGAFRTPACEETIAVRNPATSEIFAHVPDAGEDDVNSAVHAARAGFEVWSRIDPIDRARHLRKFADIIAENLPELAVLESVVTGAVDQRNARTNGPHP